MRSRNGPARHNLNPTRIVVASFGAIILVGTLLLMLPIASRAAGGAGLLTGLFTATSATCVTGLVVADTWLNWTLFGQIVILVMIQLGGLGFMTVLTLFSFAIHRRISLSERLVMMSALNLNGLDGVLRLVRTAIKGTLLFEGAGAVVLSCCFVPEYGLGGGVWWGVFHAVSAFCNAGFDLMGEGGPFSSMTGYSRHPVVLLTLMVLIVAGGLGFFVWEDIRQAKRWKKLTLYSKLVLGATLALILLGTALVLAWEWGNPATLGDMPVWGKCLNALFQSVTLRTAGFDAIGQGAMNPVTQLLSIPLMLIGGGSGSTAGGLKVGTLCILLLALRAGLRGSSEVTVRGRAIPLRRVLDALTLSFVVIILFFLGMLALAGVDGVPLLDAAFETASALGTVGLSMGVTPGLSVLSRVLVICMMFLGRVGILSFSMAFLTRSGRAPKIKYPAADVMVG